MWKSDSAGATSICGESRSPRRLREAQPHHSRAASLLDDNGYMEVETPVLHPIAGGALAGPSRRTTMRSTFRLYLRIAPELYLKRLIVGG